MFELGQIVGTPSALKLLADNGLEYSALLYRHQSLESVELDVEDQQANRDAVKNGGRISQWAETVRALRDKTAPLNWSCSDENNFPLCVHPSGNLVIAIYTGDRDTGVTGFGINPSNRAAKGTNTEQAVWANQKQLSLFDSLPELPSAEDNNGRIMWVLLYHVAPNEIRFELSLPLKMVGGKIRSWQERLVFPAIPLDQVNIIIGDDIFLDD